MNEEKAVIENETEKKEDLEVEDLEDVSGGGIWSCGNGNCGCSPDKEIKEEQ